MCRAHKKMVQLQIKKKRISIVLGFTVVTKSVRREPQTLIIIIIIPLSLKSLIFQTFKISISKYQRSYKSSVAKI